VTAFQARLLHTSNVLVGGTGLVYGWMRYFAENPDPFAIANHPWQPQVQHAHLLAAPLLIFAGAWIWTGHVQKHLARKSRRGRRTGIGLVALFFPMVFSGYLLQVAAGESWRALWIGLHVGTSAVWVLLAAVHPFLRGPRMA